MSKCRARAVEARQKAAAAQRAEADRRAAAAAAANAEETRRRAAQTELQRRSRDAKLVRPSHTLWSQR